MNLPLVTIVIATYNRVISLQEHSFAALTKLTYPNYEIVVIDDASEDDTEQFLKKAQEQMANLLYLRNSKNRGACFSRNLGAAHAKGEFIVFIDDDVSLFPDSLDQLVKIYTENLDIVGLWGYVYEKKPGNEHIERASYGSGSLWSLRRIVFDHFRFDTNLCYFKTSACDEHELARRIQKQGLKIINAQEVQATHFHAPAENRKWRGIGGDLNYLYEQVKHGPIVQYYVTFILGCLILPILLFNKNLENRWSTCKVKYKQMLIAPKRVLTFFKQGNLTLAGLWIFYILLDIPIRAKTKKLSESISPHYSYM